jgi:hypothetical protein
MTSFFGWTIPPVGYTIFYALMFVGVATFLVIASRRRASSARREPFRKADLIRAAGLLLFAAAGMLVTFMDGTANATNSPSAWAVLLQTRSGSGRSRRGSHRWAGLPAGRRRIPARKAC